MRTINITTQQYQRIRALKKFASWYIDEHKDASALEENIKQWESDRDEVREGIDALLELDELIRKENETLNLWNT